MCRTSNPARCAASRAATLTALLAKVQQQADRLRFAGHPTVLPEASRLLERIKSDPGQTLSFIALLHRRPSLPECSADNALILFQSAFKFKGACMFAGRYSPHCIAALHSYRGRQTPAWLTPSGLVNIMNGKANAELTPAMPRRPLRQRRRLTMCSLASAPRTWRPCTVWHSFCGARRRSTLLKQSQPWCCWQARWVTQTAFRRRSALCTSSAASQTACA